MNKLVDWTEIYLTYADVLKKQIINLKKNNNSFFVEKNVEREKVFETIFCFEKLNKNNLKKIKEHQNTDSSNTNSSIKTKMIVVTINDKENTIFLANNWSWFKKQKNLSLFFVNLKKNEKWAINPYTHDLISDEKFLKEGLLSLYESIL